MRLVTSAATLALIAAIASTPIAVSHAQDAPPAPAPAGDALQPTTTKHHTSSAHHHKSTHKSTHSKAKAATSGTAAQ